jgi:hypothetical protein
VDARQQFHSIVATFRTAEIGNLLIISTEMLGILNNCSTAGTSTASVVTLKAAIRGHFKTGQRDWPET